MKVILKEPPNTPTLILRLLAPVVLTCIALPAAVADCMGNPDPQSAMTRISHLSEAAKAIQDLAKAIQSKNAAQIRDIFIHRYGPSRDAGFSGPDVELWDVAEGSLWLHPQMGPSFAPKESKTIWLLI